jgi:hypothetical protein
MNSLGVRFRKMPPKLPSIITNLRYLAVYAFVKTGE